MAKTFSQHLASLQEEGRLWTAKDVPGIPSALFLKITSDQARHLAEEAQPGYPAIVNAAGIKGAPNSWRHGSALWAWIQNSMNTVL